MGVAIKDILEYETIELSKISNKSIVIDSFNMLYQFLSSIRQSDGSPLTNSKGEITSHLRGLYSRLIYFKKNNIKAVFIFDGEAPKLKEKERELRRAKKEIADKKYREALELGHMDDAKKFAQGLNKLDKKMILESQSLVEAFGFPVVMAPSEGEAQAAYMTNKSQVFASSSQDFDSLLFGAKYLIRNLSIGTRRKIPGTSTYRDVEIEFYDLEKILNKLNISNDELIIIAILCGTDFNPGGIKGIGPKKALKLVKEYRDRWEDLFKNLMWYDSFNFTWLEVFNTFKKMPVVDCQVEFKQINKDKIKSILLEADFSEEMLDRSLKSIKNIKTLDNFF